MNKLHIISSGSKANAFIVEENGEYILIDQGLTFKKFKEKCAILGIELSRIKAALVTHEHTDHVAGIPLTARELGIPVFVSEKIADCIKSKSKYDISILPLAKDSLNIIKGFSVFPFSIMHDAIDPLGFSITLKNGEKITIATDTGVITNQMLSHFSGSSYLVIEANHDPAMLYKNPKYPWDLKERIKSSYGHLSNAQCLEALERIPEMNLKGVVMAHLSEENNSPLLLRNLITEFFGARNYLFSSFIATQHEPFSVLL